MTAPHNPPHLVIDDQIGGVRRIAPGDSLSVGRTADFVVGGDDRYVHRLLFQLWHSGESWMIRNAGSALTLTVEVRGGSSLSRSQLGPRGVMPMPYGPSVITFSTKECDYEIDVDISLEGTVGPGRPVAPDGEPTHTRYTPNVEEQELLDALSAPLRTRPGGTDADIAPVKTVAAQLGWTVKKTERKIETLCEKLADDGEKVYRPKHIFLANYALRQPRRG